MTNPTVLAWIKRWLRNQLQTFIDKWKLISDKWRRASTYWQLRKAGFNPTEARHIRDALLYKAWSDH